MKKYIVKTQSSINPMNLHSTLKQGAGFAEKFETSDLAEARAVYEKEVAALSAEYTRQGDLPYSPTDHEQSHAVFCEITIPVFDDDGDLADVESVEVSDYFYEK